MILLVLSDFHLGKGRYFSNGEENVLEDFFEDQRFSEMLEFYSTGQYQDQPVHLVLNGDILNLIQIDVDGSFTHFHTEDYVLRILESIIQGHPQFFDALRKFLLRPKKQISYVIGNHDLGMVFPKSQQYLKKIVGEDLNFVETLRYAGIHIEHGHRFEPINTVPLKKRFLDGPNGAKILNLPWGSLFCLYLMPLLKKKRPNFDKVRPMSTYITWCFFHDFFFFWQLFFIVTHYVWTTRKKEYSRSNPNFKTTKALLKQISIYPNYERQARRIFKNNPGTKIVVMGHTHVVEWRRVGLGRYYFNTGTWNNIPSIDAGLHSTDSKLTYVLIDLDEDLKPKVAELKTWQGRWSPFQDEVAAIL